MSSRARIASLGSALLAFWAPARADEAVQARYLYDLSDNFGALPLSWVSLAYDRKARELFVVDHAESTLSVFNDSGMEVYNLALGDSPEIASALSVTVLEDGDLLMLPRPPDGAVGAKLAFFRCDFRGEPSARVEMSGVPEAFAAGFVPRVIRHVAGRLYFADQGAMKVLVTDLSGAYQASYDLGQLLALEPKKRASAVMGGFGVDGKGNLLVTIKTLFSAYVVSPKGEVRAFGVRGSAPGKFNIVGAIDADEDGNYFVTDLLRSVVMVFDPRFKFLGEFGYRPYLVAPSDIAVGNGKLFVAQGARRGVSVFSVKVAPPPPEPPRG